MMCSKLLRHETKHGRLFTIVENSIKWLERGYRRSLRASLRGKPLVFAIAIAVAGVGVYYFTQLKAELSPTEDRGVIQLSGTAPEGSTLAYTRRYGMQVEELLKSVPELRSTLLIAGQPDVTRFIGFARLIDWGERERSAAADRGLAAAEARAHRGRAGLRQQSGLARGQGRRRGRCSSWCRHRARMSSSRNIPTV